MRYRKLRIAWSVACLSVLGFLLPDADSPKPSSWFVPILIGIIGGSGLDSAALLPRHSANRRDAGCRGAGGHYVRRKAGRTCPGLPGFAFTPAGARLPPGYSIAHAAPTCRVF